MHRGPCRKHNSTSANRSFGHYLNESTVSHLGSPSSSNSCLRSFTFLLHRVGAEEAVGEDRFKQPGWPVVAEEGRQGRPRPWLALARPELATGSMATKLPWAAIPAGQHVQQRHGEGQRRGWQSSAEQGRRRRRSRWRWSQGCEAHGGGRMTAAQELRRPAMAALAAARRRATGRSEERQREWEECAGQLWHALWRSRARGGAWRRAWMRISHGGARSGAWLP